MPHTYSDYAERQRLLKRWRREIAEQDKAIASQASVLTAPDEPTPAPEPEGITRDALAKRIPALARHVGLSFDTTFKESR